MTQDYKTYIEESKRNIAAVLDGFKIGHGEIMYTPGPTVTLFEFRPAIGVRLSKIKNLKDEFTIALEAISCRVIAPIPGRGTVGLEVPNKVRQNVPVVEMLNSYEYQTTDMALPLVIGRTVNNGVFMVDLAEMPHLLVAGATGMGKSVGLNVMLTSLLRKRTPDEMKLVLIDPKMVELSIYNNLGNAYLAKLKDKDEAVISNANDAKEALEAVCREMDSRYDKLKEKAVRNISEYNEIEGIEKLPYYVVVVDEYGDLIMQANGHALENAICRIAQKARAVGIHMIISTQRPSATIVTGNIKANFPTRIAFRTTTGTDSRVILDRTGAERLTGRGDMLFFNGGDTTRVQCAYTSTEEVSALCDVLGEAYSDCKPTILPEFDWEALYKPKYKFDRVYDETKRAALNIKKNQLKYIRGIREDQVWGNVKDQLIEMGIIGEMQEAQRAWSGCRYYVNQREIGELEWKLEHFYDDKQK